MLKIGQKVIQNNMILAPMAGVSDYPFRVVCRDYDCQLAYSEMVSSEGLVRHSYKTLNYLYKGDEESKNGNLIGIQIFGSQPDIMAYAAEIVEDKGADIIDINMGCPVKKVVKSGAGSALLNNVPLLEKIVKAVRKRIKIPLSVKIRSGWGNQVNVLEVSQVLEGCGVDAVIIHPRTQKQGFTGKSDWMLIKKVKERLSIPIIGNGDVLSHSDYKRMIELTACDGVMIGRGSMGNPWIFKSVKENLNDNNLNPSIEEIQTVIEKHYRLSVHYYGEKKAVKEMRKHLSWYTKGLSGNNKFRASINKINSSDRTLQEVERFFYNEAQLFSNAASM